MQNVDGEALLNKYKNISLGGLMKNQGFYNWSESQAKETTRYCWKLYICISWHCALPIYKSSTLPLKPPKNNQEEIK